MRASETALTRVPVGLGAACKKAGKGAAPKSSAPERACWLKCDGSDACFVASVLLAASKRLEIDKAAAIDCVIA